MPMTLTKAQPFLTFRGVSIYPVYVDNDIAKESIPYLFSTNPLNMGATTRTPNEFDVRDLPQWDNYAKADHLLSYSKQTMTLQDAIDQGLIDQNGVRGKALKYNHMFTLAFSVVTDNEGEDVTNEELLTGLKHRLDQLTCGRHEDLREACQLPDDTYEND